MNKNLNNNNQVADEKVSIVSIGDIIEFEKIDDDIYTLIFDFTFKAYSPNGGSAIMHSRNLADTFIHAELILNSTDTVGCGGVKFAVILNNEMIEADLKEKHGYDICNKALELISQNHPELFKPKAKNEVKSNTKEKKSMNTNSNLVGKLEPITIANAMYEYTKNSSMILIPEYAVEDAWNYLSEKEKIEMVNALQNNADNFVEFINYFELKAIKRCSDETSDLVRSIVFDILSKKLISLISNSMQKEQQILNQKQERELVPKRPIGLISSSMQKEQHLLNQKLENELLNSLKVELDKFEIKYDVLKLNSKSKDDVNNCVVSICDNKGCRLPLWIHIYNSHYIALDKCELDLNNDVKILSESHTLPFNDLDYIINFINTMVSKKHSDEEETNGIKEISNDVPVGDSSISKSKSKKIFRREFILNHIDELSDEDILNELKRRMNSK